MAQTYEQLLAEAEKIKLNELPDSNTHGLVGEQLVQMTERMKSDATLAGRQLSYLEKDKADKATVDRLNTELQSADAKLQKQVDSTYAKITTQDENIADLLRQIEVLKKQVDDLIAGGGVTPDPPVQITDALILTDGSYLKLTDGSYLKLKI